MPEVIDQMGRRVQVPARPQRIISLVPSQTELLFDLGLGDRVVGITKFCIHPRVWRKSKTIVGGTKQYRFDVIKSLNPDLIIGNKEENERKGIEELADEYPVWMSDISTLQDAIEMISCVGSLTNESEKALSISEEIQNSLESFKAKAIPEKALYLIWKKPYMAAGQGTFIHEMLKAVGYENVVINERYPDLNLSDIKELAPDTILLSSEPYPFKEKDFGELKELLPDVSIKLVDGEIFSWYGSRLLKAATYFKTLV